MVWSGDGRWPPVAGLAVAAAAACTSWAVTNLPQLSAAAGVYSVVAAAAVTVGVAAFAPTVGRFGRVSLILPALVLAMVTLPPEWTVVVVAGGVAAGYVVSRPATSCRVLYEAAGRVLAATAAVFVAGAAGLRPAVYPGPDGWSWVAAAGLGAAVYVAVGVMLAVLAEALSRRRPWRRALAAAWDRRLAVAAIEVAAAVVTLGVAALDVRLTIMLPVAVLAARLWWQHRVALRSERDRWQRLAAVADALHGGTSLTSVARRAAVGAVELFAPSAELALPAGKRARLVRADSSGVVYDGPPEETQPLPAAVEQEVRDTGGQVLGTLRLVGSRPLAVDRDTLLAYCTAVGTALGSATSRDELVLTAQRFEHAVTHDPVTGLPNRHAMRVQLLTVPRGGPAFLAVVAVKALRLVNDTLGHDAGDLLLLEVAQRLKSTLRGKQFVARVDGSKFAILLTGITDPAAAVHRVKAALLPLRRPVELRDVPVMPTAVAGIAAADLDTNSAELLRRAYAALRWATDQDEPLVTYHAALDRADRRRLAVAADAPAAMTAGAISIWYEPLVDLLTGRVTTVAARPRLHHPHYGVIAADDWLLQVITQADLLTAWTSTVLVGALADAVRLRDAGFELALCVPVEPRCLRDPEFARLVLAQVESVGFPPDRLVLEMAETSPIMPSAALAELRAAGVKVGLAQFGTGPGSLATLVRIRFDGIKIDRSFVADLTTWPAAASVVRAAVDLARDLEGPGPDGHVVVAADGVVTEEQRCALVEMGCTIGQGPLTGPALPLEEFLDALTDGAEGRPGHVLPACPPSVLPFPAGARHRAAPTA
ncbi:EAL domain-containing protein [Micromonospora echinospora]